MSNKSKLNIGAGSKLYSEYVNHDITKLEGIDCVHDLNIYPWPWEDEIFEEIIAYDVLEHLEDFIKAMEELFRILKPGGKLKISVPYWNSVAAHSDPTHKRGFHECTFKFFDPDSPYCKERFYYTNARFSIIHEVFVISLFTPYYQIPGLKVVKIKRKYSKLIIGILANMFSNIIQDLELELVKI